MQHAEQGRLTPAVALLPRPECLSVRMALALRMARSCPFRMFCFTLFFRLLGRKKSRLSMR